VAGAEEALILHRRRLLRVRRSGVNQQNSENQ
jgi:hypothetical protein